MNILLDTNIILAIVRDVSNFKVFHLINPNNNIIYLSVVNVAEARSIAIRNKWGKKKMQILDDVVLASRVIEINENLISTYVEIDTFSQMLHPKFNSYPFSTPRNMGKNDLWIAATASLLNLQLVTTDSDFDHLNNTFLTVNKIDIGFINDLIKE